MYKKIAVITLSAFFLGGCSLTDLLKTNNAATDQQSQAVATSTPAPIPDPELDRMPPTSTSSDTTSLETDINSTVILEDDYSDIK